MNILTIVLAILMLSSRPTVAPSTSSAPSPFPAEAVWASSPDWGSGGDASPAFTPDGKTVYFSHGPNGTIMVSYLRHGVWSPAKPASFSGTWRDIEPAMAPDGSYLVFVSNRPIREGGPVLDAHYGGAPHPAGGGNLWRVNREGQGWSKPVRLSEVVNSNSSVFAPAIARNGNIYFMQPDPKTDKFRLYLSRFTDGEYHTPEPLSFSSGLVADFDPAVAPDESFIIFSSPRPPTPEKHSGIFVAFSDGHEWKTPVAFQPFLVGIESRLSPDSKTLYFTADRPTLETSTPTQQDSAQPVPAIPRRIWQVSLKDQTAMAKH